MKHFNFRLNAITIFLVLIAINSVDAQNRREVGNMILEDVPETPEAITSRIQQYQSTRSASFADWLPNDEGMLISTRFGNTAQLHTVNTPGGARNQISFFDEPVSNGSFCPSMDYNGFLFTKDIGGNEFSQIYWYDMNTRTSEMLSDGTSVNFGLTWSNMGHKFAFTSSRRNKKDFDIYISDMNSPKTAVIKVDRGGGYWVAVDWSPDDSKLIVIQYLSSTKSNSFILDVKTTELTQINDGKTEAVFLARGWDKTGTKIYATTNLGKEFNTLVQYDLQTKKMEYITKDIAWDIEVGAMNKSRTKAAFTVNENGFSQLYLMDLQSNKYEKVLNLPIGQIYSFNFHPSREELAMVLNTTETPGDVYSLDLNSGKIKRWTTSEVGGLDTGLFPKPKLINYETFDEIDGEKRKVPAFVYKPLNSSGPLPVMISIHGGPEGQHTPSFSSFYAYLANEMGIAVIAPNVRGSSGYGKTYLKLDNGFKRENSVKDIGKLIEWIETNSEFDKDRIAVFGGSYGGYMVLSSMYNFNDKIKCGIDIVGISNFVTFLENTEEYRRDLRRAEYGDERDPKMREFLHSISPTNHVNEFKAPLFVIQGANDPRVPMSEAEQMVKSIRENNGTVWYMLAKDEGHGFRKKENRDRMTEAVAMFLKENLLSTTNSNTPITDLQNWLAINPTSRPPLENLSFSKEALSQNESDIALNLLLADKQAVILNDYGAQWDNRLLKYGSYQMPFYYQLFGDEPLDGRSLFISLHGGGGVSASVNDNQYEGQKHLYDAIMDSLEGVYLAPRAPTDTWDLWHQDHIDELLNIIIQLAVIKENVNPNKVYILGYSAGGDGLYQLAPRMADRWAAASMMAGHPNDASPLGLRNIPFAIHVGALDSTYNRNEVAQQWGVDLDSLQINDPQGYIHDVQIHAGLGHWMNLQDAVALPWLKNYERDPIPQKVVWKQSNIHHSSFYWIETPESAIITGGEILAEYNSSLNEINIIENYSDTIKLLINDNMLDLDNPITIKYQNTVIHQGVFHRSILNIYKNLSIKGDPNLAFPCVALVKNNQIVIEENVNLSTSSTNDLDKINKCLSDSF